MQNALFYFLIKKYSEFMKNTVKKKSKKNLIKKSGNFFKLIIN